MRFETEPAKHDVDPIIPVYITSDMLRGLQKWHCGWCGLPVTTLINAKVERVVIGPLQVESVSVGAGNLCKRCKQMWAFNVIGA